MNSKGSVLAARAISSTLIKRYLFRISFAITLVFIAIVVISFILILIHSAWWTVLVLLVWLPLTISAIIALVSWVISTRLEPRKLNKNEVKLMNKFVDEFSIKAVAAKSVRKNPAALSGIIAWKYIKEGGKKPISGIIYEPIKDVSRLSSQFNDIADLFK